MSQFVSLSDVPNEGIPSWTSLSQESDPFRHARNNILALPKAFAMIDDSGSAPAKELVLKMRDQAFSDNLYPFTMGMTHVLQFAGFKKMSGAYGGILLIPYNWYVMYDRNPFFECGELVTMACRCRDFTINPEETIKQIAFKESMMWRRGEMYEADFLLHAMSKFPDFPLSPSQKRLTEKYPHGIDSDLDLRFPE